MVNSFDKFNSESKLLDFPSKVFGISYRQENAKRVVDGMALVLVREKTNEYDSNAIKITLLDGSILGYISKELALKLAPKIDSGTQFVVKVTKVTGASHQTRGVNIRIMEV